MINWKNIENLQEKIDDFAIRTDLSDSEKEIFGVIAESTIKNDTVSGKEMNKYIDLKVSELLSVKKKIKKYS